MDNYIFFENGIKHELGKDEISVIRKALHDVEVEEGLEESLSVLKSLFFEFLD